MGFRSLPSLLIQTLDGLIKVRPRILQVDTANMTLVENPPGTLTLGASGGGSVATDVIWDAKGDIAVGTGADTAARLAAGTNTFVLTADSTQTTGLKWAAGGGSAITIAEVDGAPSGTPGTLKFPNTTLTDNGDGSYTFTPASDSSKAPVSSPTFTGITTAPEFSATGLTGATAASRYVGATTSGAPVSGTFATGDWIADQTGARWTCTIAGTPGTWAQEPGTGGGALTTASSVLGAPVTCTTANTYYDGPSVVLASGTWFVTTTMTGLNSTGGASVATVKLWDGTNLFGSTEMFTATPGQNFTFTVSATVVLGGSTTVKASMAWNNDTGQIAAATNNSGTPTKATQINAIKVG